MPATRYPRANTTAQWYADTHAGETFGWLEKAVIHSTEGRTWPGYGGGALAPNLTCLPSFRTKTLLWRQHFPINMSSRAMKNAPGGVQTNRDRAVQIEIVGTCDFRSTPKAVASQWMKAGKQPNVDFLNLEDPPDWVIDQFAEFVAWMHTEWDMPLITQPLWKRFDASYGANNGVRLKGARFDNARGWIGHQHADENAHGDPGPWPMRRIINAARQLLTPVPEKEPAVVISTPSQPAPLPESELDRKYREYIDEAGDGKRDERTVVDIVYAAHANTVRTQRQVAALTQQVADLTEAIRATHSPPTPAQPT